MIRKALQGIFAITPIIIGAIYQQHRASDSVLLR